eukprot:6202103-Alexandrium_andersonii.AAC.1
MDRAAAIASRDGYRFIVLSVGLVDVVVGSLRRCSEGGRGRWSGDPVLAPSKWGAGPGMTARQG